MCDQRKSEKGAANSRRTRPRPALFQALGHNAPPLEIEIGGAPYRRREVYKHDSWAATALYEGPGGQLAICKFNRQQSVFGIPMGWLGRRLGQREARHLERLAGLPGIPPLLGPVRINGREARHACVRVFLPGHVLGAGEKVNDDFFPRLERLLAEIHRRDMAYVDLHKRENILVLDDGSPGLIDFQISYTLPRGVWGRFPPLRWWLRCLQRSDDYHLLKHRLRCRPDQFPGQDPEAYINRHRPWWIRLHRFFAVPLRFLRRRLLVALGIRSGRGSASTETNPEVAFRD